MARSPGPWGLGLNAHWCTRTRGDSGRRSCTDPFRTCFALFARLGRPNPDLPSKAGCRPRTSEQRATNSQDSRKPRFDLNDKAHDSPLHEPRCHYHPGVDEVRLPCPVLTPLEVLDRIFLVIEPQLLASS